MRTEEEIRKRCANLITQNYSLERAGRTANALESRFELSVLEWVLNDKGEK